jgi:GH24 family phage-related lysozyme (muramidase)
LTVKLSRLGLLFIARREGLVLTAYQDGEHHSVGFGHNDPALKPGDTISVRRAFELLKGDVRKREPNVVKALDRDVKPHEFDALFSLYYQGGSDGLQAVAEHINAGNMLKAADEFLKWDTNAKGEHLRGLLKRRRAERDIFLNADYGELTPIPFWRGDPRKTERGEYIIQDDDL